MITSEDTPLRNSCAIASQVALTYTAIIIVALAAHHAGCRYLICTRLNGLYSYPESL